MKVAQTPSAPLFGAVLIIALLGASPAGAKSRHQAHSVVPAVTPASAQTPSASHRSHAADAGLAVAGAVGAAAAMFSGSHSGSDSVTAVVPSAPAVQVVPTAESTPKPVAPSLPGAPYVTMQPPSLVVTVPLHRSVTTTSVVIPTPYVASADVLQIRNVDRTVGVNIAQGLLPAQVVDRGIYNEGGNSNILGVPEPASAVILLVGAVGLGALVLARKRSAAA